jgi:hypothetical protein
MVLLVTLVLKAKREKMEQLVLEVNKVYREKGDRMV